ncbi:MAG: hypothetical protein LBJ25_05325, partial [Candidatus Margulisbacteria bacterium]|nr:hypothetical protein [Candidatus Margulisiibacteriota bacterium]
AASGSATHSHGNGTLAVSVTGGTHEHTITDPGHTHTVTAQAGSDGGSGYIVGGNYGGPDDGTINTGSKTTGISIAATTGAHEHTVVVSGATATDGAAHDHGITGSTEAAGSAVQVSGGTIGSTGSGTAFKVVPEYYPVIYIKKMV